MTSLTWLDRFKHARRAGVPLIGINTPDPASTIRAIAAQQNGANPIVQWDICRGVMPVNEPGRQVAGQTGPEGDDITIGQPPSFLQAAADYPEGTIAFMHNAQEYLDSPVVRQGVWNLRDEFKQDRRTLVMLSPALDPPANLAGDIVILDEPLPDRAQLEQIVKDVDAARLSALDNADAAPLDEETVNKAVDATLGLASYPAENAVSMAVRKTGLDLDHLWETKRKTIELTKGLSVYRGNETFADVQGLDALKSCISDVIRGRRPPSAIIWIDEIEKMLAGSDSDTSGVTQDILGAMLTAMTEQQARGFLIVGPAGTGKSFIAQAAGGEARVPTIQWDSNAMKNSLVGASGNAVRQALKIVGSVSNNNALWLATCNRLDGLPTALQRRLNYGTYYVDLPTPEQQAALWRYYIARYELTPEQAETLPESTNWTGFEIRTCCQHAADTGQALTRSAIRINPVAQRNPAELEKLRAEAENRYLDANADGTYTRKRRGNTTTRTLEIGDRNQ